MITTGIYQTPVAPADEAAFLERGAANQAHFAVDIKIWTDDCAA